MPVEPPRPAPDRRSGGFRGTSRTGRFRQPDGRSWATVDACLHGSRGDGGARPAPDPGRELFDLSLHRALQSAVGGAQRLSPARPPPAVPRGAPPSPCADPTPAAGRWAWASAGGAVDREGPAPAPAATTHRPRTPARALEQPRPGPAPCGSLATVGPRTGQRGPRHDGRSPTGSGGGVATRGDPTVAVTSRFREGRRPASGGSPSRKGTVPTEPGQVQFAERPRPWRDGRCVHEVASLLSPAREPPGL
jgi:hypothetical protein